MSKNKKKHNKAADAEQELSFKLSSKLIARILAGGLAALMVLGTITMTIIYLFGGHVH